MVESKEIDWGGSAFPCEGGSDSNLYPDPGMSLRDYFAGQALAGICANSAWNDMFHPSVNAPSAQAAYAMADAMLKARKESAS